MLDEIEIIRSGEVRKGENHPGGVSRDIGRGTADFERELVCLLDFLHHASGRKRCSRRRINQTFAVFWKWHCNNPGRSFRTLPGGFPSLFQPQRFAGKVHLEDATSPGRPPAQARPEAQGIGRMLITEVGRPLQPCRNTTTQRGIRHKYGHDSARGKDPFEAPLPTRRERKNSVADNRKKGIAPERAQRVR